MTRRSTASHATGRSTAQKATATVRGRGRSTWTEESGWESNTKSKLGRCLSPECYIMYFKPAKWLYTVFRLESIWLIIMSHDQDDYFSQHANLLKCMFVCVYAVAQSGVVPPCLLRAVLRQSCVDIHCSSDGMLKSKIRCRDLHRI